MPEVTVIIPVYNAAPWLLDSLNSVLSQPLRNIELICVDDGSTDGSGAILAKYALGDSRVRVLSQANAGLGAARNAGLAVARGRYVVFLDADDELSGGDALSGVVHDMDQRRLDVLFFDADTSFDPGCECFRKVVPSSYYIRKRDYSKVRSGIEMFHDMSIHDEFVISACLMGLRRDFMESRKLRFREGILHEDNIFVLEVILAAERVAHVPIRPYLRRVRNGSIMTSPLTLQHLRGCLVSWKYTVDMMSRGQVPSAISSVWKKWSVFYRWRVRNIARQLPESMESIAQKLAPDEAVAFHEALEYPFREKILNGIRCLKDNGFLFTVRRILLGAPKA